MNTRTCVSFAIVTILITEGLLKYGRCSLDIDKRTGWEAEGGGGWAPPPMPMQPPPKIILIDNKESSNNGNQKEDKISMLLPVVMTLGPLIMAAIMVPIFMSILSGIMTLIKSLLAMKMPSMMPSMPMMISSMMPTPVQMPITMPMPMPMPMMPTPEPPGKYVQGLYVVGRKHNHTSLDSFRKVDSIVHPSNSSKALMFGRGF